MGDLEDGTPPPSRDQSRRARAVRGAGGRASSIFQYFYVDCASSGTISDTPRPQRGGGRAKWYMHARRGQINSKLGRAQHGREVGTLQPWSSCPDEIWAAAHAAVARVTFAPSPMPPELADARARALASGSRLWTTFDLPDEEKRYAINLVRAPLSACLPACLPAAAAAAAAAAAPDTERARHSRPPGLLVDTAGRGSLPPRQPPPRATHRSPRSLGSPGLGRPRACRTPGKEFNKKNSLAQHTGSTQVPKEAQPATDL